MFWFVLFILAIAVGIYYLLGTWQFVLFVIGFPLMDILYKNINVSETLQYYDRVSGETSSKDNRRDRPSGK